MKEHLRHRISRLQAEMAKAGLDIVIFTDRENLIYYFDTVEIECMGAVIPLSGEPMLCCLWLDAPYVRERAGTGNVKAYNFPASAIGPTIVDVMKELECRHPVVGFHKYFVEFAVFDAIRRAFPDMEWRSAAELTYRVRSVKDDQEIGRIVRSCEYVDIGMRAAVDFLRPGVTEVAVLAEAEYAMRKAGSEGASFRMQVLTWPKQLLAHPFAGNTVIENNQPIVIHLGATCEGYAAKMCRTVFLGKVPEETARVYELLRVVQKRAMFAAKPAAMVSDIYEYACAPLYEAGYGDNFLEHLGYGVGVRQSEFYPIIGKGLTHVIEKNMVVDLLLPTIYKRGVGGPRLTDIIRITEDGGKYMTAFTQDVLNK
ncbi:MAG: Xaa-Pro peptidase family protein [Desulfovibrio sp.]|jgi:Xaa-Pro aminopeptidase|nr:Xaa-Pro peptidase family protein [Desulfovibrio sp.]